MTPEQYAEFVNSSDRTRGRFSDVRGRILRYGFVGAVGAVIAAVQQRLLADEGVERRFRPDRRIAEELGDLLWHCFALYDLEYGMGRRDLLTLALCAHEREAADDSSLAQRVREWLGPEALATFRDRAAALVGRPVGFAEYQQTAFLTARTDGQALTEVCLTAMSQYTGELLRSHLPAIEREFNRDLPDREARAIIYATLWHLSALATLFGLDLAEIAFANRLKLMFRLDRRHRTPRHDADAPEVQQFPATMQVQIVRVGDRRSQMIWDGEPLGDPLTDNAREPDGYRFHDVMHLANAALLGWSPVLRKLMGRKRKYDPVVDEVEDGARAQIVEEALVKIIHSEGVRLARERGADDDEPLIRDKDEISFAFLKLLRNVAQGLEVEQNRDWEWEDAVLAGLKLFAQVRQAEAGQVDLDFEQRRVTFTPVA